MYTPTMNTIGSREGAMIRALAVDDQAMVADSLRRLLDPSEDIDVVIEHRG
jgi:hypothetical protein